MPARLAIISRHSGRKAVAFRLDLERPGFRQVRGSSAACAV